jgi:hypothetical protein
MAYSHYPVMAISHYRVGKLSLPTRSVSLACRLGQQALLVVYPDQSQGGRQQAKLVAPVIKVQSTLITSSRSCYPPATAGGLAKHFDLQKKLAASSGGLAKPLA